MKLSDVVGLSDSDGTRTASDVAVIQASVTGGKNWRRIQTREGLNRLLPI
jgi:hypothetical protein